MAREITGPVPVVLMEQSWNKKHTIQFNEETHRYKLNGKQCPGVTTIIKGSYPTSMGLIKWMQAQAVQYTVDWFTKRGQTGPLGDEERTELFKEAKVANEKTSQEAADIGTLVHGFCYLTELGKQKDVAVLQNKIEKLAVAEKITNGINRFKDWKKDNSDELVSSETLIASPTYMFCGKFDRLAKRDGKLILSDFKTSKSLYLDQFIQLGAYSLAIKEWLGMSVQGLEVLRFGKEDGEFQTLLVTDPEEIRAFEAQAIRCRETYEFKKLENDERWKYGGKK